MSFSWKILAASAAVAALLSGCSSVSLDESAKDGTLAGQTAGSQTQAVNPFADPNNPLSKRSVYFSFDSYEVEAQYMPAVEAHARWLAAHPNVNIIIQGNTDERGGREYIICILSCRKTFVLCSCKAMNLCFTCFPRHIYSRFSSGTHCVKFLCHKNYFSLNISSSSSFPLKPTDVISGFPFLNKISVGILTTINFCASTISSSTLTFPTLISGCSFSICSTTGDIIIHGPHHDAQKSIRTGLSLFSTSELKLFCVITIIKPLF